MLRRLTHYWDLLLLIGVCVVWFPIRPWFIPEPVSIQVNTPEGPLNLAVSEEQVVTASLNGEDAVPLRVRIPVEGTDGTKPVLLIGGEESTYLNLGDVQALKADAQAKLGPVQLIPRLDVPQDLYYTTNGDQYLPSSQADLLGDILGIFEFPAGRVTEESNADLEMVLYVIPEDELG